MLFIRRGVGGLSGNCTYSGLIAGSTFVPTDKNSVLFSTMPPEAMFCRNEL